jgi:hypothetical protein
VKCSAYVSAGDNPHASGDVAYTGCSVCGLSRDAHPRRVGKWCGHELSGRLSCGQMWCERCRCWVNAEVKK